MNVWRLKVRAREFLKEYCDQIDDVEEDAAANAKALVGSGLADPHGKKPGKDSAAHKKLYPPQTNYSKSRKKYNSGAKPGANDGFVG